MTCPVCVQEISKGATITCFGQCKRKFHLNCLALSVEDIKRILEKGMKWKCNVKYCFIGNGYNSFISYKEKELCYLVSRIEFEIDDIEKLFKNYALAVKRLTDGLNDFQGEFKKLKDQYDQRGPQEEDKMLSGMVPVKPITLNELESNGWVASKNKKQLKKSFEFESGNSAICFINCTSKVLEKEPILNMPQITLQIKTVTVVLASKDQEEKVDSTMYKTAYMIDGAAPSVTEKDRSQTKQAGNDNPQSQKNQDNKPQNQSKQNDNPQSQKNQDNKPQNQSKQDDKPQTQDNNDNKTQSLGKNDNRDNTLEAPKNNDNRQQNSRKGDNIPEAKKNDDNKLQNSRKEDTKPEARKPEARNNDDNKQQNLKKEDTKPDARKPEARNNDDNKQQKLKKEDTKPDARKPEAGKNDNKLQNSRKEDTKPDARKPEAKKNDDNKLQNLREENTTPETQKKYENKSNAQGKNDNRTNVDKNNNSEPKTNRNDRDESLSDDDDDDDDDDEDNDDDSRNKPCYFY